MKKMMLSLFALLVAASGGSWELSAQESDLFKLVVETRFDYQHDMLDGAKRDDASGFKGKYFNLCLDGRISEKFDFSYRQRLNRAHKDESFFDATDWLWLNYQPTQHWGISAGKQVVMIGGFEYDRSPIDLYFCSEFWHHIGCYQFGASVTYTSGRGNDKIIFQACQSPFDTKESDLYAFNLLWSAKHGCYTALHSFNAMEFSKGHYIYYVALGNSFQFGDARLQLDLTDRSTNGSAFLKDYTLVGEFSYLIADRVNLFVKATYDKASDDFVPGADLTLYPGSELTRIGGGVEYYPLGGRGDRSVRLHAAYAHSMGTNTHPEGALLDQNSLLTVGLTWRVDVLKIAKKLIRHE